MKKFALLGLLAFVLAHAHALAAESPAPSSTPSVSSTTTTTSAATSVVEQIKKSGTFDPETVGSRMEAKGRELMQLARSGSNLYLAVALVVFLALLIAGLFFKKMIKTAFYFGFVAVIGYLILNHWDKILNAIMAVLKWLFGEPGAGGGETAA